MLASSPAVPTTTAVAAAALNYGDTAGFDEIVRLKHAEADAAATLSDCATQNATLRADLEETRRQLLLVVAQRDALHAALHETRARGGSGGGGGGGGTAAAAAAAASAAAVEHKVAVEGYQKELALQREELVSVEQQRAVMSSQIGRLTEEVRSFGRALDATLRELQVPSPPDSPPLDKLHLLAAAAAAMAQTVAEGEKAQRTLESRVAILSEKDREHTALIEGYQALQHKMAAEGAGGAAAAADLRPGAAAEQQQQQLDASGGGGGGKMRAGAPLSAAGQEARITALQAQLSKLRAENVALMEKEAVTQTGAGAGTPEAAASPAATSNSNAVLAALQMEITRLHGKLKGKKDTITSLKALIRKHVDATGGLGAGVAASRAGSPPATPPAAAAHHRAAGGAGAAGLAGRATPPVGMVGGGGLPHSRGYSPVRQRAC